MRTRELRLMAVGLGGLALVVAARGTEDARNADASGNEEPSVVAGDPGSAGGASGLADQVAGRSIRLLDFTEVDQSGSACTEALPGDVPETIDVSGGQSDILDENRIVQLVVDDSVVYGNLDEDTADEAVVHTTCAYGANGQQDRIQVWDIETGTARPKASIGRPSEGVTGRFPGTVQDVAVENGQLLVTWSHFADSDPRCCHSELATLHYEVDGNRLRQVGDPEITPATS